MKYYLIAGEASGDLHASNLLKELKKIDSQADFRFFGGDLMQKVGGTLVKHYKEMAFMGFIPVVLNAGTILRNMRICKEDIQRYQPDVLILIDYPGFNLKIAKYVKEELNIPVYYYISPKIWAWKKYRIKDFRKYVDKMFCILPFETKFYENLNYHVDYVGNPCVDAIAAYQQQSSSGDFIQTENLNSGKPIISLLAGSRKQEIKNNLPTMLKVTDNFPDYQIIIAGAPGIEEDFYTQYLGKRNVKIVFAKTYALLENSVASLVTSGTATLEAALFRIPQVVCYYVAAGKLSSFIFKHFFHTPFISLVNLIAGKEVVQELFGARFSSQEIYNELYQILNNNEYRNEMLKGYDEIIHSLGKPGASKRTAEIIYKTLNS